MSQLSKIPLERRVYASHRVADLLSLPMNVKRADEAFAHDLKLVARYAAMTTPMPPIRIVKVPGGFWVSDGGHRLAAARMRGDELIPTLEFPTE
jgi:hypothetical protein